MLNPCLIIGPKTLTLPSNGALGPPTVSLVPFKEQGLHPEGTSLKSAKHLFKLLLWVPLIFFLKKSSLLSFEFLAYIQKMKKNLEFLTKGPELAGWPIKSNHHLPFLERSDKKNEFPPLLSPWFL